MKRRLTSARTGVLSFICTALTAAGQAPAPPVPPLTQAQKEAAAAIEAPKTLVPPPLPGQLKSNAPAKPADQAPAPSSPPAAPTLPPVPAAPVPSSSSASKMQALEAVTQKPSVVEAPRVLTPSDKIPVTSSTSSSRQFIVHGKVFETRSGMSSRCDEIAQEVRKALNDKDPWVLPIVVLLNTGEEAAKAKGPPVATTISELNFGGFHIQVTINEKPGLNAADLRKEVVRALLAERILRNHQRIEAPQGRMLLPDWVMTGVLLAMDYRSSANPSAMFSALYRSGKIYSIEEIIEASPVDMDGLSRTIYETSCCALVLALVEQPEGPQRLNKFLNALAVDQRTERELIGTAFPNLAVSSSSLNKWWSLQLAALAKPGFGEPLSPAESVKAIEEAIFIHYEAAPNAVPKNIQQHPFILPAPLQVASASAPPPAPSAAETAKPKTKEEAKEETAETAEKPKRSLIRRLLFLGDADSKEAAEKPDKDKTAEEENKPGFMSRLFGAGSEEKNSAEEPAKDSKAKSAAEKEKKAEEEAKPGFMGRLFGGSSGEEKKDAAPQDTKPADKTTATAADKEKKAEEDAKPGFMGRLFGSSGSEDKKDAPEAAAKDAKPKPVEKAATTVTEKEKKAEEGARTGLMDRLFSSSASEEKKTPTEAGAKDKSKPIEKASDTAATSKDKKADEDKKPGLMGRLFGSSEEKKDAGDTASKEGKAKAAEATPVKDKKLSPAEKEKAAAIEKPKTTAKKDVEPQEEAKKEEEKKPTKLNPMNWFRGDKKTPEEKPAEKPAKEKQTSYAEPDEVDVARLISPLLADAWQLFAPAGPRQTVEPLFDFRKRKTNPDEEKKEEPKEENAGEKKTQSSPKKADSEDKPAAKKSSKPHTTNPNAKPASKSAAKAEDKPRTNNPQARPATTQQAQTAAASGTAAPATTDPALVQVTLPIEEYKHILNHPDKTKILSYNIASLRALEMRVSVLFRPVVRAYLAAVMDIEAGKTKDMDKRLATLHEFALVAYQKSVAVRDYVDWFEASESGRLSGKFDGYLGLPETIKKELPERKDPISKYLDAIDKEFSK
ncbi:hypothetical protein [Prosthecobacter vanneervenii]|uniref:Elongation factor 1 beta central acidic region eukaryote domain-containing protein n=1 Tax=Prosthecobacter vanneervenii TaxID=48466 RepID=A0A7W7YAV9_9BACT|nr:hypothetical protein [Prosthecobacter vanneervenii]MBB5032709.1 hypothetical protein [Prosthecobacter vanneervenii]